MDAAELPVNGGESDSVESADSKPEAAAEPDGPGAAEMAESKPDEAAEAAEAAVTRLLALLLGVDPRGPTGISCSSSQPGSFIAEPKEVHRFFNGPEVSEVFFIAGPGDMVECDENGNDIPRQG